jgi:Domain of unknown function (DUF222)
MSQTSVHTVSQFKSGSFQAELAGQLATRQLHKEQLGDQITELAAHIHAATFRLLELIREFDSCEGWAGEGVLSCAHWLNWKCGMAIGVARERVRVAHALKELPKISQTFRKGKISYSKVRAITRVATRKNENYLLMISHFGTAHHVEQVVTNYRSVKRNEALESAQEQHVQRELRWFVDDDGYWVIRGRLPPESGALVAQVLEQVIEEQYQELRDVPAGIPESEIDEVRARPEPIAWRRADALVRMATGYSSKTRNQSEKYLVHIHTDLETLKQNGTGAEAEIESGGIVCSETTRRIACDSSVVQWLDKHDGQPLSTGRKSRTIAPAIRRALQRRDGGCRFPGCTARRFVDAHHIRHWADGGDTCMENLVLLCTRHHHLVHEAGFGLEKLVGGKIQFTNPQGEVIPDVGKNSRGNVDKLYRLNLDLGIRITPRTAQSRWMGEKMDDQLAVEGLLFRE